MGIGKLRVVLSVTLLMCLGVVSLTWADPAEEAYAEGMRLLQAGQAREALTAFDKAIRLKPTYAEAYRRRGIVHHSLSQYDRAIKDYDEAVRLNPNFSEAYYDRANAYSDSGQAERALKDYDTALRLAPRSAQIYYNRSLAYLALDRGGEAAADARAYLDLQGWRENQAQYMVLVGYVGNQLAQHDAEARQLLEEAKTKCDTAVWPYPIIRYLRREITADALQTAATDPDKQTEAQTYLGLDLSLAGRREEALTHLRWVKDNGNKSFAEYTFATTALHRLEAAARGQP